MTTCSIPQPFLFTSFIVFAYLLYSFLFSIDILPTLPPFTSEDVPIRAALIFSLFIWLVVYLVKRALDDHYKHYKTGFYKRSRANILTGLVLISLVSIVAKCEAYSWDYSVEAGFFFLLSYVSLITAIYSMLVFPATKVFDWDLECLECEHVACYFSSIYFLNLAGLLLSLIPYEEYHTMLIQTLLSLPCASSTLEAYLILLGKVEMNEVQEDVELEAVVVVPSSPATVTQEAPKNNDVSTQTTTNESSEVSSQTSSTVYIDIDVETESQSTEGLEDKEDSESDDSEVSDSSEDSGDTDDDSDYEDCDRGIVIPPQYAEAFYRYAGGRYYGEDD